MAAAIIIADAANSYVAGPPQRQPLPWWPHYPAQPAQTPPAHLHACFPPKLNIGLHGAFKPQIHRIWGGAILTSSGRALRSQEGCSKFQLTHLIVMGNGNPREVCETD